MAGVIKRRQGAALLLLSAPEGDFNARVPRIGAHVHFRDCYFEEARILHFEADDLGKFLADRCGDPRYAPFVHVLRLNRQLSHSSVAFAKPPPSSAAASCSTDCRIRSAWLWSEDTVTAANAARCHRSWYSISATATLNLFRRRSFRLLITCRLSFRE